MGPDKYAGKGGTFEVKAGERVRLSKPGNAHAGSGGARDKDGKPLERPVDKVEPALPAPAAAPWETPAPADSALARGAKKGG